MCRPHAARTASQSARSSPMGEAMLHNQNRVSASDRVAANERKRLIADVERAGIAADGASRMGRGRLPVTL